MDWGSNSELAGSGKSDPVLPACRLKASYDEKVNFGDPIRQIDFPGKASSCIGFIL